MLFDAATSFFVRCNDAAQTGDNHNDDIGQLQHVLLNLVIK